MRIGIDAREALIPQPTGKGVWARSVIAELKRRDIDTCLFPETNNQQRTTNSIFWHCRTAYGLQKRDDIDLYLSPTSYLVPYLAGKRVPCAVVVHDLIAFQSEPHDWKAKIIERMTLPKVLKTAKHIFAVSEATKRELLRRFPRTDERKITVVYEGPTTGAVSSELKTTNSQPYILSIGTLCPRKNQLRLIRAFNSLPEELRTSHALILAGDRGWQDEAIVELAQTSEHVEWRGYVSTGELRELLTNASALAYPSLTEGFGLPILDAMTLGVPVLTSNQSSMPEVAGDAALFVDPTEVSEIAAGLKKLLTDKALRRSLIEKGKKQAEKFSWKKTVDSILNAPHRV